MLDKHKNSNDLVSIISREDMKGCKLRLKINVDSYLASGFKERAIDEVIKEVSLPGFRKGKVPREYVIDKLSDKVDVTWQDSLAQKASEIVLKFIGLPIIPPAMYSWESVSEQGPNILELVTETYPIVPDIDLHNLPAMGIASVRKVSDEDIDNKLNYYLDTISDWKDSEDNIDDTCKLSYEILDDNGNLLSKEDDVQLRKISQINPDHVLNMVCGESKKIDINGSNLELKITKIQKKERPELDQQIANKFGVQSVDELRSKVRRRMQESLCMDLVEASKDKIQKILADSFDFDLPESLLSQEICAREKELLKNISDESRVSADDKTKIEKEAIDALKSFFIIDCIASRNSISLSEEQKQFVWSQSPEGPSGDSARQRMASNILTHEVCKLIMEKIGVINV